MQFLLVLMISLALRGEARNHLNNRNQQSQQSSQMPARPLKESGPLAATLRDEFFLTASLLTVSDGLSVGYSTRVVQDALGYLWFGTRQGLNRYDGYSIRQYFHDSHNDCSLKGNLIYDYFKDSENRLWVATGPDGLAWYDPKEDCFHKVKGVHDCGGKIWELRPQFISQIHQHKAADTLFLLMVNYESKKWKVVKIGLGKSSSQPLSDTGIVQTLPQAIPWLSDAEDLLAKGEALVVAPDQSLWVSTREGYFRISESSETPGALESHYFHFGSGPHLANSRIPDAMRLPVLTDRKGNVYTLEMEGIYAYDKERQKLTLRIALPQGYELSPRAWFDNQDRLWSAWNCNSFLRFDLENGTFDLIHAKGTVPDQALCGQGSGFEDATGNYWIITNGYGVIKINGRQERFHLLRDNSIPRPYAIRHRQTSPGKKAVYSPEVFQTWLDFKPSIDRLLKENGFPTKPTEHFTTLDSAGIFYTCLNKEGAEKKTISYVAGIDPEKNAIVSLFKVVTNKSLLDSDFLILDRQSDFWFSTKGSYNTVFEDSTYWVHLDRKTGNSKVFPIPRSTPEMPPNRIVDWCETPEGDFWLATQQGLMRFSRSSHQWAVYINAPGDRNSLSENHCLSVMADPVEPDRRLWVGTRGGGLNELDLKTGKFKAYHRRDGLPDEVIYGILADKFNHLWLSTNNGLCQFDLSTHSCDNFGLEEGLPGLEFNTHEFCEAENGELIFGGVLGVVSLDPEEFLGRGEPSPLVFNSLKMGNRKIDFLPRITKDEEEPFGKWFQLPLPMEFIQRLEFNYDQNDFAIGFAVLDFHSPHHNIFKYRLRGYSDQWIDAGTDHEASFTNLNPGSYTLEVLGRNSGKIWSPVPARLEIEVHPPWWGTWWFRAALVLAIVGSLYALYRYRLHQALKVERLRNRIAQDLHDEIGSTLSSVGLLSEVMLRSSDQLPPQTREILRKITESTSEMIETMNDIVWSIKATNDRFQDVISRMRAFSGYLAESGEFHLIFDVEQGVEDLRMSMEKRKNIYLIFKEAVNNAAKYSSCNQLTVTILLKARSLQMQIEDDGIGFDLDGLSRGRSLGGNGLGGMKNRADEIQARLEVDSAPGTGTRITLLVGV